MHVELRSGIEAGKLLLRNHGKYTNGVKGLYLLSFVDCELGQAARTSYFVLRQIDDLLDGERRDIPDPLAYAFEVQEQIKSGNFNYRQPIAQMAERAVDLLEKRARLGDNPRDDFARAIDSIVFDFKRSQDRCALSGEELDKYYQRTFSPVINLMLIGLQSQLRSRDIPELVSCQGRVYSIRDLRDDWTRGTINIPREVLQDAKLTSHSSFEAIRSSGTINNWFNHELSRSQQELQGLQTRLSDSPEWLTVRMCNGLIHPMIRFVDKFRRDGI